MSPRLKVSNLVIERVKKLPECSSGQLFGICNKEVIFVIEICVTDNGKNEKEETKDSGDLKNIEDYDLVPNLPSDICLCGIYQISNDKGIIENFTNNITSDTDIPVALSVNSVSKELTVQLYESGTLTKVEFDIVSEKDILDTFAHLRLTATIPISCDAEYEHVKESFKSFQEKVTAGNAAFRISDSNIYILGDLPENISGISPESSIEKLFSVVNASNKNEKEIPIVDVNLFLRSSNNDTTPQLAPVIKYVKKVFKHINIQLPLDAFSMVWKQLKMKDLYPVLVESLCRNLTLMENCVLQQLASNDLSDVSLPQIYHFLPSDCGHFISIAYPSKLNLEQQKKFRESFHILLGLPLDKPLFRPGNAYDLSNTSQKNDSKILLNPHEGLKKSGVPDGEPYFVQGNYAYHHYMQDNFDDSGWGCAYRSLQTICSWFKLQGYTNRSVPTHKEIQQCLVDIGDKPSSFVGSNQWIGSTEVGFVLDSLLGVTCRIVRVSSGEELSMKGGELSYHFRTQGTPVMIGGGVLAHTILGVDYNKKTGAIKFLILDPHYTGSEDLNIIQSKGWCGWKGPEFWKKDAFYNMCMPLKPKCV